MPRTSPTAPEFRLDPCSTAECWRLEAELGVSPVVAQVLVRRGLADPVAARDFLSAGDQHSPRAFRGLARAVELILGHVEARTRITVHGDYDCDGVCSTAVLVGCLRRLGADVDWYLPDREADGYGLSRQTVDRLVARGTGLLVTADCAITAVAEVAHARAVGLDVVVTDHHQPRPDGTLPDAAIVHPSICDYPCPDLCATAVAAKLAEALRDSHDSRSDEAAEADLELVALATIADVVPLRGENRRLVRDGLRAIVSTTRPGLRALIGVARLDQGNIDEQALAFRLAPRINAAGRLYRPDAALELLLTDDPERAGALALELDRANAERRHTETRILFEAEAMLAKQDERGEGDAPALVLAGEGWHPGVIGIVASRIAERRYRPAVVIALPEAGETETGRGSGRSIPGFDLLAGLDACAGHLRRHGGHRAAAGLEIAPDQVDAFRAAFVAHAAAILAPGDLVPVERVDAVASGEDVGLGLAEELRRLAPFGAANPPVTLLLPSATLADPVGFGGEQRADHVRFSVASGPARARAVAFGAGKRLPVDGGEPVDATFRLERNEWNGVVEPRLVLRHARPCQPASIELLGEAGGYFERALVELDTPLGGPEPAAAEGEREARDARGRGIAATITTLVASGERLLVVAASAELRLRALRSRLGGFGLCSHAALEYGRVSAADFEHVVVLDPPGSAAEDAACRNGGARQAVHLAWGMPELRFAQQIHEREYGLRGSLVALYRTLRDRGGATGEELESVLREACAAPHSAALAGRLLRVLLDLDLIELDRDLPAVTVLSGPDRTQLERSIAYRVYQRRLEDGRQYLESNRARAA